MKYETIDEEMLRDIMAGKPPKPPAGWDDTLSNKPPKSPAEGPAAGGAWHRSARRQGNTDRDGKASKADRLRRRPIVCAFSFF